MIEMVKKKNPDKVKEEEIMETKIRIETEIKRVKDSMVITEVKENQKEMVKEKKEITKKMAKKEKNIHKVRENSKEEIEPL